MISLNTKKLYRIINILLILAPVTSHAENVFQWPDGAKAAVSLAYDDALNSQLDNAVPALDKHNFKASFYLTLSASTIHQRIDEWRAIAKNGHELANHTINHACSASLPDRDWVATHNDLDTKSLGEIKQEIINANSFLKAIDGESIRTFTLPCADNMVEGKNYLPEIQSYFVGIKSHIGYIPNSMKKFDPMNAPVWTPSDVTGTELINYVKLAAKNNTIANITFHGIGGDYLSVSSEAHQALLAYLAKNKHTYWVDTYRNISLYLQKQ
ncbi:MAG: polysaccharide deacetylase family protein [Alteromonadaceae bacterium]|nr:polysaccharide deacetylase family protein [Alteromonadaceae bacterium]